MKLQIDLQAQGMPLPADQQLAWNAAMETLAEMCLAGLLPESEEENVPVDERSHAAARPV